MAAGHNTVWLIACIIACILNKTVEHLKYSRRFIKFFLFEIVALLPVGFNPKDGVIVYAVYAASSGMWLLDTTQYD